MSTGGKSSPFVRRSVDRRVKSSTTLCVQLKLHTKADSGRAIDANGSCGTAITGIMSR